MLEAAQDARLALSLLIIPPAFPSRGAQQTQREVSWQPTADRHRSLCVVAHAAVRTRSPPALLLLLGAVAHCAYQSEKNLACDRTMVGPELDYTPTARYAEATKETVLHPLIDQANCILVPGAYFGDEGKGKTVDAIARHPDVKIVARVNRCHLKNQSYYYFIFKN